MWFLTLISGPSESVTLAIRTLLWTSDNSTLHLHTARNSAEATHSWLSSVPLLSYPENQVPCLTSLLKEISYTTYRIQYSISKPCRLPFSKHPPHPSSSWPWGIRYETIQPPFPWTLEPPYWFYYQVNGRQWTSDPRFKAIAGTKPWASGTVGWYQVRLYSASFLYTLSLGISSW